MCSAITPEKSDYCLHWCVRVHVFTTDEWQQEAEKEFCPKVLQMHVQEKEGDEVKKAKQVKLFWAVW